jgi:hypothetical protein
VRKSELPKMPRLPRVPLADIPVEDPASRPLGPPPSPDAYRQSNPYEAPPAEYKAPSLLAEHKGLAIVFIVALLAFVFYCWKMPHRSVPHEATTPPAAPHEAVPGPNAPPIYIETVPDKDR